jgi:hypothetical protein
MLYTADTSPSYTPLHFVITTSYIEIGLLARPDIIHLLIKFASGEREPEGSTEYFGQLVVWPVHLHGHLINTKLSLPFTKHYSVVPQSRESTSQSRAKAQPKT